MEKKTHPFLQLLMLMLFMVVLLFVGSMLTFLLSIPNGEAPGDEAAALGGLALVQLLSFGLPPVVVGLIYHNQELRSFFRADVSWRKWLLGLVGVVVLLLLLPLNDWLSVWNEEVHFPESLSGMEESLRRAGQKSQDFTMLLMSRAPLPLSLLCMALVPAVCEELFFRAGVQNLLQQWFSRPKGDGTGSTVGVHVAVWVTAAVFSLFHGEVFAFLPRLLMGALLGYLYVGGGSLVVNMTVHFVNNAIVVVFSWLYFAREWGMDPTDSIGLPWTLTLACSAAAVLLFVLTFGKRLKISN